MGHFRGDNERGCVAFEVMPAWRGVCARVLLCFFSVASIAASEPDSETVPNLGSPAQQEFDGEILPVLQTFCGDCHGEGSEGEASFLIAASVDDVASRRALWRSVATQLRNRTMPPSDDSQPTESQRIKIVDWIEANLRATALSGKEFAGMVTARRLNRREYANTIRDLLGVELDLATTLPVDSGGGEGFDNNGETLFLPPLLLERYLETAQRVLDAAVIPPPMKVMFLPAEMILESRDDLADDSRQQLNLEQNRQAAKVKPERITYKTSTGETALVIPRGDRISVLVPIPVAGNYRIPVGIVPKDDGDLAVMVEVDDLPAAKMTYRRYWEKGQATQEEVQLQLTRGLHKISIRAPQDHDVGIVRMRVVRVPAMVTPVQVARHMQLLGVKHGHVPSDRETAARNTIRRFAQKAFRRPVEEAELSRYWRLFQRASERGDSYEECIKITLKAILVAPDLLFRLEQPPQGDSVENLTDYELATRLSYLLWSTQPDDELRVLARLGVLQRDDVLRGQVERMLADARSKEFFTQFIGQWLGTRDLGGRRAATENSVQNVYTPFIAADMREQAVLLFEHIIREDRSVLELLDSNYTFLTGKLAKFYGLEGKLKDPDSPLVIGKGLERDVFARVALPTSELRGRYGGLLGLGGVLTLTSHISQRETSPVLRGAWVLDTLLGTRVPSPPDDVPVLDKKRRKREKLTLRETLDLHREDISCAACHNLMDPIGFGLENFDFLGRWRDEDNGKPIDASGKMPSGAEFSGPAQLKQILLGRKEEFTRQLVRKLMGYALGRSLVDADESTIERLVASLEASDYRGQELLKSVVLSVPFRKKSNGSPWSKMEEP